MNLQSIVGRANLLYDSQRWDLALAEYQRCLALDPDDDQAHCKIAMCLTNMQKNAQALESINQALALAPDSDHHHYVCSYILQRLGQPDEAYKHALEAIALAPDVGRYHAEAAECLLDMKKLKEAEQESQTAVELAPHSDSVWHTRGVVLLTAHKLKEAHVAVDTMMEIDPENWRAHSLKGLLLKKEGKFSESVNYYREALRIDPTSTWARTGYMDALRGRSPAYNILVFFSTARAPRFFFLNPYVLVAVIAIFGLLGVAAVLVKSISPHLLNIFLALDPEAKNALDRKEQLRAKILGVYTVCSWVAGLWLLRYFSSPWMPALFLFVYLAPVLLTRIFEFPEDSEYRRKAIVYVAMGLLFGLGGVVSSVVSKVSVFDLKVQTWTLADTSCGLMFVFLCFTLFARAYWREHQSFF